MVLVGSAIVVEKIVLPRWAEILQASLGVLVLTARSLSIAFSAAAF